MRLMPAGSVDVIFADPPYRLSTGGMTVRSGRLASVDKGGWDRSLGSFEKDHAFNVRWLREARRVLKPDGTLWVSGTHHIIFSLGFALQRLGFRVINNIVWSKPNPTPNALHTAFTHFPRNIDLGEQEPLLSPHLQLHPHKQPQPRRSALLRLAHPHRSQPREAPGLPPHPETPAGSSGAPCWPQVGRGILSSTRSVALARLGWQPRSWGDSSSGRRWRGSIASWLRAGSKRPRGAVCCVRSGFSPLVVAADLEPGVSACQTPHPPAQSLLETERTTPTRRLSRVTGSMCLSWRDLAEVCRWPSGERHNHAVSLLELPEARSRWARRLCFRLGQCLLAQEPSSCREWIAAHNREVKNSGEWGPDSAVLSCPRRALGSTR